MVGFHPKLLPVEQVLSCPRGGFPSIRHNEVRDTIRGWLSEVCSDMMSVSNCIFSLSLARCSMALQQTPMMVPGWTSQLTGFWEASLRDVRVFNPHAPINKQHSLSSTYKKHERIKIRAYEQHIHEIERGPFTPLVMSLTGGSSNATNVFFKRLASIPIIQLNPDVDDMQVVIHPPPFFHPMHSKCPFCSWPCLQGCMLYHQRTSCCLSLVFPNLVLCYCLFSAVSLFITINFILKNYNFPHIEQFQNI